MVSPYIEVIDKLFADRTLFICTHISILHITMLHWKTKSEVETIVKNQVNHRETLNYRSDIDGKTMKGIWGTEP